MCQCFLATIFGCAFILGIFVVITQMINGRFKFHWKNIVGGIVLGVPNYYSMEFLLKAFKTILKAQRYLLSIMWYRNFNYFFALLFFKEKLIKKNWIGIALAVISILLVSFA